MEERTYLAIDLKSFYASVECVERGLDPLTANLVVADRARTEKTICLAVSPSLKAYGIPGRARLFEVVQKVGEVNALRRARLPRGEFSGSSWDGAELARSPQLAVDYIVAPPQMAKYIQVSTRIYDVYLKYIAPEDIHVYSIDEVFLDVTHYLKTYGRTARELAREIILDVLETTGITATAGIGTNLYLCKVAMDVMAKRSPADERGVRIAQLDEREYRRLLWEHRPLTDFWRVGRGYARKLEAMGLYTMGDIARCSLGKPTDFYNEGLLYKLFGVNAELLIDHAWGWEPCTMADIKAYKPKANSVGSGQVLQHPYTWEKAALVVREMTDALVLDLVDHGLAADQMVLTVGYDRESLSPERGYRGAITTDPYGRSVPRHAHGSVNLGGYTNSAKRIRSAVDGLFERITDKSLLIRRLNLAANHVLEEGDVPEEGEQLDLFSDSGSQSVRREAEEREKRMQTAILDIRKKYGKNAILKGMDLEEGATAMERNRQIGGHRA